MHAIQRLSFNLLLTQIRLGIFTGTSIVLRDYGLTQADLQTLLSALAASLGVRSRITEIDLSNSTVLGPNANTFTHVVLKGFKNLKRLSLSKNNICYLELDTPALEELDVSINNLSNIVGLENLKSLKILNIAGNLFNKIDVRCLMELTAFYAARNKLLKVNLSNKPKLQIATLDNNKLQTLYITGAPLTEKFTYTSTYLDSASRLALAKRNNGLNLNYYGRIQPIARTTELSNPRLAAAFAHVFIQEQDALNAMFHRAYFIYHNMLQIKALDEQLLIRKIVFEDFVGLVMEHFAKAFNSFVQSADQPHNADIIASFMQDEYKTLLKAKLDKAEQLLDAMIKKGRSKPVIPAFNNLRANVKTNPSNSPHPLYKQLVQKFR